MSAIPLYHLCHVPQLHYPLSLHYGYLYSTTPSPSPPAVVKCPLAKVLGVVLLHHCCNKNKGHWDREEITKLVVVKVAQRNILCVSDNWTRRELYNSSSASVLPWSMHQQQKVLIRFRNFPLNWMRRQ